MSNPNPKLFTPENRGKKPRLSENEKSVTFTTAYPESLYTWIKAHGGGTYIRKLVYADMPD